MYIAYASDGYISSTMDLMLGGLELGSLALVWLAFAAPASYRRWIERLASTESRVQ